MKKRFTVERKAFALRKHEAGKPVKELAQKMRDSDVSFYAWK
jgi:hypothetical protein